jgi:putative endonuclease
VDAGLRRHDGRIVMEKGGWVYILASKPNGILYTGVTSDLVRRVYEHREGLVDGFTKRYGVKRLVYFERHDDIEAAILREKQVKEWKRAWRVRLILKDNPEWEDLYDRIV